MHALAAFKEAVENPTRRDSRMQATDSAVRREITVNATPERAFVVFTEQFDTLVAAQPHDRRRPRWPRPSSTRGGLRWYEVGVDGRRATGARSSPTTRRSRLTLEWRIGGTWELETDPAAVSEIDVTFTPEGDATRVTLEHRHLDRHTARRRSSRRPSAARAAGPACCSATPKRWAETPSRRSSCSTAGRPRRAGRRRTRGPGGRRSACRRPRCGSSRARCRA